VPRDRTLLRALLRACCGGCGENDAAGAAELARAVAAAAPDDWERAVAVLSSHRLLALVHQTVGEDLLGGAPESVIPRLRAEVRATFVQNGFAMGALDLLLSALEWEGVEPIVLKGAALLNMVYPSLGARPMVDVDLLLKQGDEARALAVLDSLGHARTLEGDAWNCVDAHGTRFDVVHRFRIFEHLPLENLVERTRPKFLKRETIATLEPNAMVVHLVVHMNGHRREIGHLLAWFVDVARYLRENGARIDAQRLAPLLADVEAWTWLLRTLAFLRDDFGVPLPPSLEPPRGDFAPLTLDEVLRSRRVRDAAASPGRLVRHLLRPRARADGTGEVANASDFVGALGDLLRERRARKIVERWRAAAVSSG
jgi:putative nucleotidyltransferase-like protein